MLDIQDIRECLQATRAHLADFHDEALEAFRFQNNDQWPEDVRDVREEDELPTVTFNQVNALINAVSGTEMMSRFRPQFLPIESNAVTDASLIAEKMNKIFTSSRSKNRVPYEESQAFWQNVVAGVGATDTYMDYLKNPEGRIKTEWVPIHYVGWDPSSKSIGYEDAAYVFRGKLLSQRRFKTLYPDAAKEVLGGGGWIEGLFGTRTQADDLGVDASVWSYKKFRGNTFAPNKHGKERVLVWDYHYYEDELAWRVHAPGSKPFWVSKDQEDQIQEILAQLKNVVIQGGGDPRDVQAIRQTRRVFRTASVLGDREILDDYETGLNCFPVQLMTGYTHYEPGTIRHFGLMRLLKEPQQFVNKLLSEIIHRYRMNPKGIMLYEEGAVNEGSSLLENWAKADASHQVPAGSLSNDKIRVVESQGTDPALQYLLGLSMNAMSQATGVNPQFFAGQANKLSRTSTSAIELVQQQGMTVLAPLFDSLTHFRHRQANLFWDTVREYWPDEKLYQVGEDEPETVRFIRSEIAREFDIKIIEVPATPNQRGTQARAMLQNGFASDLIQMGLVTRELIEFLVSSAPPKVAKSLSDKFDQLQQVTEQQAEQARAGEPPQGGQQAA